MVPFDYALFDMSYANLMLYSASLPSYDNYKSGQKDGGTSGQEGAVKADDPKNKELVKAILNGYKF